MKTLTIDVSNSNQRLDKFLLKYLNRSSKSFIYKMLRKKRIKLNGKKAEGNEILLPSDILTFYISDETLDSFKSEKKLSLQKSVPIDIVYEDDNILIVNKPKNLLSHPESKNSDSLIDRILFYLYEKNEFDTSKDSVFTPALCNRLDRNTSGLVICGKNLLTVQAVNKSIKSIEKYYYALALGKIQQKTELVSAYSKDNEKNFASVLHSSDSDNKIVTILEPVCIYNNYTLLKINLVTGKSHQIRVHLSSIGTPIVGDKKYGDAKTNRFFQQKFGIDSQLLHSSEITFKNLPDPIAYLNNKKFISELPEGFDFVLKNIKNRGDN